MQRHELTDEHQAIVKQAEEAVFRALLLYVVLAKSGNPEKIFLSHPEFISGSTTRDAETSSA